MHNRGHTNTDAQTRMHKLVPSRVWLLSLSVRWPRPVRAVACVGAWFLHPDRRYASRCTPPPCRPPVPRWADTGLFPPLPGRSGERCGHSGAEVVWAQRFLLWAPCPAADSLVWAGGPRAAARIHPPPHRQWVRLQLRPLLAHVRGPTGCDAASRCASSISKPNSDKLVGPQPLSEAQGGRTPPHPLTLALRRAAGGVWSCDSFALRVQCSGRVG